MKKESDLQASIELAVCVWYGLKTVLRYSLAFVFAASAFVALALSVSAFTLVDAVQMFFLAILEASLGLAIIEPELTVSPESLLWFWSIRFHRVVAYELFAYTIYMLMYDYPTRQMEAEISLLALLLIDDFENVVKIAVWWLGFGKRRVIWDL